MVVAVVVGMVVVLEELLTYLVNKVAWLKRVEQY